MSLDSEFGSSPVSSLVVIPDGISSSHSNPLGNRAVLFLLNTKGALGTEGLVGRHFGLNMISSINK